LVAELWGKLQQFNQEITLAANTTNLDGEDLVDNQEKTAVGQFKYLKRFIFVYIPVFVLSVGFCFHCLTTNLV